MKRVFSIFFGEEEARPWLVLLCLLLSGVAEAASISSLLPAVTALAGGVTAKSSALNGFIRDTVGAFGIGSDFRSLFFIVVGLMIVKSVLSFAAVSYAGMAAARVSIGLRRQLIASVFGARWSYFAGHSGGRFANALSNDAGRAGDAYLLSAQFVAGLMQNLAYMAVALFIDWRLALAGLTGSVVMGLSMGSLIRASKRAGFKQTDRTSTLTVYMVDVLANIKALKSMQRYDSVLAGITRTLKQLKRTLIKRELAHAGLQEGSDAVNATVIGGLALFATTIWQTPLPELLVSGIVYFQIVNITAKLLKQYQQYVQFEAAYVRTRELIAQMQAQQEVLIGRLAPKLEISCRFENVTFSHAAAPVVEDVSFDIPARAITVLSGPSGAGKTTIIDLLIGLNRPDAGRILIDATPLADIDLNAWRRMIGYVPQELSLFHSSIRDNITLGDSTVSEAAIIEALVLAGAGSYVASLDRGLDTDVGEMGSKLSGGQRQRISLARALVTKPQVLILDEVTSALDPQTEAEIVANILALRGRYTIIAITHRPAWTAIAGRLYRVGGGTVVAEDKAATS